MRTGPVRIGSTTENKNNCNKKKAAPQITRHRASRQHATPHRDMGISNYALPYRIRLISYRTMECRRPSHRIHTLECDTPNLSRSEQRRTIMSRGVLSFPLNANKSGHTNALATLLLYDIWAYNVDTHGIFIFIIIIAIVEQKMKSHITRQPPETTSLTNVYNNNIRYSLANIMERDNNFTKLMGRIASHNHHNLTYCSHLLLHKYFCSWSCTIHLAGSLYTSSLQCRFVAAQIAGTVCCTGPLTICSIINLLVACSDRISWPLSPIMHRIWLHIAILLGHAIPAKNLSKVLITCRSHQSIANSSEYPRLSICGVVGIGRTYRKPERGGCLYATPRFTNHLTYGLCSGPSQTEIAKTARHTGKWPTDCRRLIKKIETELRAAKEFRENNALNQSIRWIDSF